MVGLLLGNTSSVLVVQRTEGVHVNFINFGVSWVWLDCYLATLAQC